MGSIISSQNNIELYTELMLLITKLMNTNITMILHSKNVMKIIKLLSDIDYI